MQLHDFYTQHGKQCNILTYFCVTNNKFKAVLTVLSAEGSEQQQFFASRPEVLLMAHF